MMVSAVSNCWELLAKAKELAGELGITCRGAADW